MNRKFTADCRRRVRDVALTRAHELEQVYETCGANVYRDHPFYESPDPVAQARKVLATLSPDLVSE